MCVGASTVGFSCVFLRDVVTLWVNSVFVSLLIANEGLHWWLFLSDVAEPFWGRVVVFIRPPSASRIFLWLVAALLPGLSLSFDSGLSSPGLICCLGMLPCCPVVVRPPFVGPQVSLPSFLSFALQRALVVQVPVASIPIWFSPFAMGSPQWGRGWFHPRSARRFGLFLFPCWAISSGSGHLTGPVCWSWIGFEPLSEASLCALSLQACFLVVLAEAKSLTVFLALSCVLPYQMLG